MSQFDLGTHTRSVWTTSVEAQRLFDLGLNWCFGFNHDEAVLCFEQAAEADPKCAMAYWGMAYASGPFYNYPWRHFGTGELVERTQRCHEAIQAALACLGEATSAEHALVEALARRFQKPHPVEPEQFDRWDDDYRDAMRRVHEQFPDDHDVMALFVEALITRTPWRLWDVSTGLAADGADTIEAMRVCDRSIELANRNATPLHPGILHMHIHTMEMSNRPQDALRSADELATKCPDAGHLNHMPGHIYVLCGEYEKARQASLRAIAADAKYVAYAGPFNFYTTNRCHDLHLMMYTCMLMGRFQDALDAADQICDTLTPEVLGIDGYPQLVSTMEGYYSMRMHVLIRFGRWQDVVDSVMPPDPDLYCVSTAMHHYARGVAHASLKDFESARQEQAAFAASLGRIPASRRFFNNSAQSVLAVGEKMLEGELEYHRGQFDQAFEALREAVRRDDNLAYTEPWAWMHPPRHALAALLLEQGRVTEAETHYRADLGLDDSLQRCSQHPNNVWSLHGLAECLRRSGHEGAPEERHEVEALLQTALAFADVPITSSCMCRSQTRSGRE